MKAFFTSSAVSSSSGSGEQPAIFNSLAGSSAEQPVCEAKPMPQSTHYPKPPPPELPDYDYQNCTEQTVREAKPMPQSTHYPKPPPPELPDYDYQNCQRKLCCYPKPPPPELPRVRLKVVSAITGEQIQEPILMNPHTQMRSLLSYMQYLAYHKDDKASLIRLKCDDCIFDPHRSLMQYYPATEHFGAESEPMVMQMIAEPVLLTWEQLIATPTMRKQAGRGGKGACIQQRILRAHCLENHILYVDLATSGYNWRLLLKTMPCLNTPEVIGSGIVGVSFRLLADIDPNYGAARHVFELNCANGNKWHLHFHQRGSCNRTFLPFLPYRVIPKLHTLHV